MTTKIEELKKHDLNCNVFSVYDYDGLSMQELLCQFFTKINECVKSCNNTFELSKWLVDNGLSEEVAKKLNTWVNDGTIESIINEQLFSSLNDKIDGIKNTLTLNILDFNVDREGKKDSTEGFKKAIELLGGDYSKGGSLFIPQGKYKITDTLFIPPNVQIFGDGKTSYFSTVEDEIGTSLIFECDDIEKPCVSFIGKNNLNQNTYSYSVSGSDLDNGLVNQTISSSLKNLTLYTSKNHNVGVVFGGCPLSTIEDVSIKGFNGGIISSANWGCVINRVFTQTSFFGVLTIQNTNNLQINSCYFDRVNNISSLPTNNKLFKYVSVADFLKPNTPTGIFARYSFNLKVTNTCIEHWENGIQTGGSGASTNWDTIWLEDNNQPITTQSETHSFKNIYVYGVKGDNSVVLASGNSILLENIHGNYNKLFKDNYQRYVKAIIINCKDNNKFIQFFDSEKLLDNVYVDADNGNDFNFGNETMPVKTLNKALELVANYGVITLLTDINVYDTCRATNKTITIKSNNTQKRMSPLKTDNIVRQIEFENSSLTFENIVIDTFINATHVGDPSYTAFFKPLSMGNNSLTFKNCTINTKNNFGILQHNYSNLKSYTRFNLCNTNIIGDGAKSKNGYESGTLHIIECIDGGDISSSLKDYDTSSILISRY